MQEDASGNITWDNKLGRSLVGPAGAEVLYSGFAAVAAIAFATLF